MQRLVSIPVSRLDKVFSLSTFALYLIVSDNSQVNRYSTHYLYEGISLAKINVFVKITVSL